MAKRAVRRRRMNWFSENLLPILVCAFLTLPVCAYASLSLNVKYAVVIEEDLFYDHEHDHVI